MREFLKYLMMILVLAINALAKGLKRFGNWVRGESYNVIRIYPAIAILYVVLGLNILEQALIGIVRSLTEEGGL